MNRMQKAKNLFSRHHAIVLTVVFMAAAFLLIRHHEMWRDELQAWLIAGESQNIKDLFHYVGYEGHPAFWHLLLFIITRFTANPIAMQVVSVLIGSGIVYLFTRYAPFTLLQKSIFIFGYFILYEYTIIARNYGVGILLLFLFAALFFVYRSWNPIILAAILFFVFQTNAFAALLALVLSLFLIFDLFDKKKWNWSREHAGKIFVVAGVCSYGALLFLLQAYPQPDFLAPKRVPASDFSGYSSSSQQQFGEMGKTSYQNTKMPAFTAMWRSYMPITNEAFFWSTNIVKSSATQAMFSVGLFLLAVFVFIDSRKYLLLFVSGNAVLLIFLSFFAIHARYGGHLFIFFILCWWLKNQDESARRAVKNFWNAGLKKFQLIFITIIFISQAVGGLWAARADYFLDFSAAQKTARYVEQHHVDTLPLVGYPDYAVTPIAGYLDKKIYFPQSKTTGNFVAWHSSRKQALDDQAIITIGSELIDPAETYLLLITHPIHVRDERYEIKLIFQSFDPVLVGDEFYYVYLVHKL